MKVKCDKTKRRVVKFKDVGIGSLYYHEEIEGLEDAINQKEVYMKVNYKVSDNAKTFSEEEFSGFMTTDFEDYVVLVKIVEVTLRDA